MAPIKSSLLIFILLQVYLAAGAISFSKNFEYKSANPMADIDWPEIYENVLLLKRLACGHNEDAGTLCSLSEEVYALDDPSKLLKNNTCTFEFMNYQLTSMQLMKIDRLNDDVIVYDIMYRMRNLTELLFLRENLAVLRKVQIVNMKNCELITEIDIKDETRFGHQGNLLVRSGDNEIFDIFYADSKQCENSRVRIAYNSDGKIVDGPVCYMNEIDFSLLQKPAEFIAVTDKKFFVLEEEILGTRGYLVNYDGKEVKRFIKRKNSLFTNKKDAIRISTDYEFLTICRLHNLESTGKAVCSITDFEEDEKVAVNLSFPYKIQAFEVVNLENGDFLTLIGRNQEKIEKKDEDVDLGDAVSGLFSYFFGPLLQETKRSARNSQFYTKRTGRNLQLDYELRRYKRNGNTVGESIPISGDFCGNRPQIVETDDNKVCVSYSCKKVNWSLMQSTAINFQITTECVDLPK